MASATPRTSNQPSGEHAETQSDSDLAAQSAHESPKPNETESDADERETSAQTQSDRVVNQQTVSPLHTDTDTDSASESRDQDLGVAEIATAAGANQNSDEPLATPPDAPEQATDSIGLALVDKPAKSKTSSSDTGNQPSLTTEPLDQDSARDPNAKPITSASDASLDSVAETGSTGESPSSDPADESGDDRRKDRRDRSGALRRSGDGADDSVRSGAGDAAREGNSGSNRGSIAIPDAGSAPPPAALDGGDPSTVRLLQSVQQSVVAPGAVASVAAPATPAVRGGTTPDASTAPRIDSARAAAKAETATKAKHSSATDSSKADMLSRIKLIQRVSKAFQHLGADGGVVRLRLAPAELGTVRIEMRISQKKVEARVVADTEAASAALREHLPELRARLESFGMNVERIEVETDASFTHQESHSDHAHQDQDAWWSRSENRNVDRPERASAVSQVVSQPAIQSISLGRLPTAGVDVRL